MRLYYCEKQYICGNYTDIQIYPVYPSKHGRGAKRKPSREAQKNLNEENSKRKLERLVNTNFSERDYMATFTYRDGERPENEQDAKRDIQNFFRRAKRFYQKVGIELKYLWIMESGKKTGKIHFHAFMTGGSDRTKLEELWKKGYLNTKALRFDKSGVAGLTNYVTKDRLIYRHWSSSKNLQKPIEKHNNTKLSFKKCRELYFKKHINEEFKRAYPQYDRDFAEYEINETYGLHNEFNGEFYFSVRLYKRQ